jgi:hypothetical protein
LFLPPAHHCPTADESVAVMADWERAHRRERWLVGDLPVGSSGPGPRQRSLPTARSSVEPTPKGVLGGRGFDPRPPEGVRVRLEPPTATSQRSEDRDSVSMGQRPLQAGPRGVRPAARATLERSSHLPGVFLPDSPRRASRASNSEEFMARSAGLGEDQRVEREGWDRDAPAANRPPPPRASPLRRRPVRRVRRQPAPEGTCCVPSPIAPVSPLRASTPASLRLRRFPRP